MIFRNIFYFLIGVFGLSLTLLFTQRIGVRGTTVNEYTVYQKASYSTLVNHKLKEDVNDLQQSTNGIVSTAPPTSASGNTSNVQTTDSTVEQVWEQIKIQAQANSVDPLWIAAYIAEESEFKNLPMNSAGCIGYMQVSYKNASKYGATTAGLSDMATNVRVGTEIFRYNLDSAKSLYRANDESNTLGQQYMYAQLLMGCWTTESLWTTRHEGYSAYNKIRRIYKEYVSGRRQVGDRCWDIIKEISVDANGNALPPMTYPETN